MNQMLAENFDWTTCDLCKDYAASGDVSLFQPLGIYSSPEGSKTLCGLLWMEVKTAETCPSTWNFNRLMDNGLKECCKGSWRGRTLLWTLVGIGALVVIVILAVIIKSCCSKK